MDNEKEIELNDQEKAVLWQQRFFEAQAACEEYIMKMNGFSGTEKSVEENSKITAKLLTAQEPDEKKKILHYINRIKKQLKCYNSVLTFSRQKTHEYEINNQECGIWKYRLEAQRKGVNLTFKSPCQYCKKLNTSIAQKYDKDIEVKIIENDKGCQWTVSAKNDRE